MKSPLAGRAVWGLCGRAVWNSTDDSLRRFVWQCNAKNEVKARKRCDNKHIGDWALYQESFDVFNALVEKKEY